MMFYLFSGSIINMKKINTFVKRLDKIGIKVELVSNYPWIYIRSINGKYVTEKFQGNHGFTVAFSPIREGQELQFTDIGEIFKLLRKYTKSMYNLFLDDTRSPIDVYRYTFKYIYVENEWTIVRNYDEFVKVIETNGVPDIISFDHDLADEHYGTHDHLTQDEYDLYTEKTGYHCAKWLINYCIDKGLDLPKTILIHTMNAVGARNIASLFNTYEKVHGK